MLGVGRRKVEHFAIQAVGDAQFDGLHTVEAIEVRDGKLINAIQNHGISGRNGIEPSATPGAAGGGAEFAAHRVETVAERIVFGGEWPLADTRGVGFEDAHDLVNAVGRHATAGAGSAGGCVGAGDIGVCAVVDIEEGSLGSFEEHVGLHLQGAVQEYDGVGNERPQDFRSRQGVIDDLFRIQRWGAEALEEGVVLLDALGEFFLQHVGSQKVARAKPGARGLVGIGRTDAALGGADFFGAFLRFAQAVEGLMVRKNEVRRVADE